MTDLILTEQLFVALLVVASVVAIAARYLRQPYTVALVIAGLGLSLAGPLAENPLSRELILLVFLPPLLFEGALNTHLEDLRRRAGQVAVLAIPGTAVTVGVLWLLFWALGLGWVEAALLGVILSPTDPVSVLAIFKEHGVGAGLRTLMEGESIFNDGLAIVLYVVVAELFEGREVTVAEGVYEFGAEVVIGVVCGAVVGLLAHRLMATTEDHLVEITISIVAAFGPYLAADQLGGSGVIATVVSGLLVGNYGTAVALSPRSRLALLEFWEVMTFIVNSLLFLLMARRVDLGLFTQGRILLAVLIGFVGIQAARAVITYGLLAPFPRSGPVGIPMRWRHAMWWGGLRGAIPIALVLGLPDTQLGDLDAVGVVFGVVLVSLLGQGLTFKPLLDRLGITGVAQDVTDYEEAMAGTLTLRASLDELDRLHRRGDVIDSIHARLREDILEDLAVADRRLLELSQDSPIVEARQVQQTARRLAAAQKAALADAGRRGQLSQRVVDAQTSGIDEALREADATAAGLPDVGLFPEEGGQTP